MPRKEGALLHLFKNPTALLDANPSFKRAG